MILSPKTSPTISVLYNHGFHRFARIERKDRAKPQINVVMLNWIQHLQLPKPLVKLYERSLELKEMLNPVQHDKNIFRLHLRLILQKFSKSHNFLILCLIPALLLTSCEDFTFWKLELEDEGQLVVEAILTDELKHQEIRLSETYLRRNDSAPATIGAMVVVEANGVEYDFIESSDEPGLYRSEIPFEVVDALEYHLRIEKDGETYTATSELSSVAPMPEIDFVLLSDSARMVFNTGFAPLISSTQQAFYEMNIDWSHLTDEEPNRALQYFYTFKSIHISELIRPRKEPVPFPKGSVIIARKYGLNDDYADFLLALQIETEWDGNFYFTNSENLPTNISNGAIGFFSTCAVVADTLVAE